MSLTASRTDSPLRRRADPRPRRVIAAVLMVTAVAGILTLTLGDYPVDVPGVWQALIGAHEDRLARYFVREIRLPRVIGAVLVGAALGASGAIFQSLSRNPLGSPDLIGFTTGAATGALVEILLGTGSPTAVAGAAVLGGVASAVLIYLLAARRGVSGFRLVLVGVGIAAVLQSVNALLVVRADLAQAQSAAQWLAGSFNDIRWPGLVVLIPVLAVLLPWAIASRRSLDVLALGDELAGALGVAVGRSRLLLIVVGVLLVAVATAAVGPIAFVALGAPQVARRLTGASGPGVGAAAAVGGLLVLVCDVLAQRLFAPTQLAVGSVTGALGGAFLVWLLVVTWRGRRP
ncbi:iron chelate uptake ABC transporter family permease subunit [Nakamurella sp. YIM 132087]|uniref:Iron chelate uptake ABC transporter family permease subunit n=2 Tax=Nakamurella alba TaxID=2665158 RepID=A0A7K1FNV1_9ACTN|nr:iron chelate uptake ABC transporter family permease subunit [Nakamurella alba]